MSGKRESLADGQIAIAASDLAALEVAASRLPTVEASFAALTSEVQALRAAKAANDEQLAAYAAAAKAQADAARAQARDAAIDGAVKRGAILPAQVDFWRATAENMPPETFAAILASIADGAVRPVGVRGIGAAADLVPQTPTQKALAMVAAGEAPDALAALKVLAKTDNDAATVLRGGRA